MSAQGAEGSECEQPRERPHRKTQLMALAKSMTSTLSGSSRKVWAHCRVVCTTPTWTGSKIECTEDPMRLTQTLLQSLRSASPTATRRERGATHPRPNILRNLPFHHQQDDLGQEPQCLVDRRVTQSILEVRGAKLVRPCTRCGGKSCQSAANEVRINVGNSTRANRTKLLNHVAVRCRGHRVEKTELVDDSRSGRNRWVSSKSRASPAERTLCSKGVNPGRRALTKVKTRFRRCCRLVMVSAC